MTEIPLGYSEEYDLLPAEGEAMHLCCQGCDRTFKDRMRRLSTGCQVLAVLCPVCRSTQRMRFAAVLPVAWTVRR